MNDEFLQERARAVRLIADRADPFTKKRLLTLADRYEGNLSRPSRATTRLSAAADEAGQGQRNQALAGVVFIGRVGESGS
jgi:hypothetical protein